MNWGLRFILLKKRGLIPLRYSLRFTMLKLAYKPSFTRTGRCKPIANPIYILWGPEETFPWIRWLSLISPNIFKNIPICNLYVKAICTSISPEPVTTVTYLYSNPYKLSIPLREIFYRYRYIWICEFKYLFLTQSINFSMTCYCWINKSWLSLQWTFSPVENLLRQAYHLSPYIYPKRHSNSALHLCAPHNVRHRQIGCKYRNRLQCEKVKIRYGKTISLFRSNYTIRIVLSGKV